MQTHTRVRKIHLIYLIATADSMVGIKSNNNNKIKTLSIHDTIQQIKVHVPCNLQYKTNIPLEN